MTKEMPKRELILYQAEDGRTHIEYPFEGETIWLTHGQMAELCSNDVRTICEHLVKISDRGGADDAGCPFAGVRWQLWVNFGLAHDERRKPPAVSSLWRCSGGRR